MRLFSTDIDGTVFDGPQSAALFRDFWKELTSDRPRFLVYNTGRAIDDARNLIQATDLPEPDYLIGGVGTEIISYADGTHLRDWDEKLTEGWDLPLVERLVGSWDDGIVRQPEECQNPFKSSWFWHEQTRGDIHELDDHLRNQGLKAQVVYSSQRDLDVLPQLANKGNAIRWLADLLSLANEEMVVAGDSGNDASMFLLDDIRGIVVSNAETGLAEAVSGATVHHAARECAAGVIEGLEFFLRHSPNSTDHHNEQV